VALVEVSYSEKEVRCREGPPSRREVMEVCDIMVGLGKTVASRHVPARGDAAASAAGGVPMIGCHGYSSRLEMMSADVDTGQLLVQFTQLKQKARAMVLSQLLATTLAEVGRAPLRMQRLRLPNALDTAKGAFAFVLRGVLSAAECEEMIHAAELRGFERALISDGEPSQQQVLDLGIRHAHRNMWDDPGTASTIFSRVRGHLPLGPQAFGLAEEGGGGGGGGGGASDRACRGVGDTLRTLCARFVHALRAPLGRV
jgi:hypothetical protein